MNFIRPVLPITDALMANRPVTDAMIGNRIMVDNLRDGSTSMLPSREAVAVLKDTAAAQQALIEEHMRLEALYNKLGAQSPSGWGNIQGYQ